MSVWSKILGTIETVFQVGLGGPRIRNDQASSGSVGLDARTSDDASYANVRAADPLIDDDVATMRYVDERVERLAAIVAELIAALAANGVDLPLGIEERMAS